MFLVEVVLVSVSILLIDEFTTRMSVIYTKKEFMSLGLLIAYFKLQSS
jgi:hypothetical protein